MIVGLPKEIKDNEYRVGITPAGVRALTDAGHRVVVEQTAGEGSGFEDSLYLRAGAKMLDSADKVWGEAEMIVKVKEPVEPEYPRMREGQLLFTYLHLAPDKRLTQQLLERKVTGIAYETITRSPWRVTVAHSHVGSRRSYGYPGGRPLSRKDERRSRHIARGRTGCTGGPCCDNWRGRGWYQRRENGSRHGSSRNHH